MDVWWWGGVLVWMCGGGKCGGVDVWWWVWMCGGRRVWWCGYWMTVDRLMMIMVTMTTAKTTNIFGDKNTKINVRPL